MGVRVMDRRAADGQLAGRGLDRRVEAHVALVERQRDGEGLEGRAGFEGVGEGAVAQLCAGKLGTVVRVVGGQVGERQHFAALGVEHDDATGLGLVVGDGLLELRVGEILQLGVEGQRRILAFLRRADRLDVLDDLAAPVLDDTARARLAGELAVERELDAFLAGILGTGEAEHVRGDLAGGIVATVFVLEVDARQLEAGDLRGDVRRDLALEIDEVAFRGELARDLARIDVEQRGEFAGLGGRQLRVFGNRPDGFHRRRNRQHVAVAVENAPARGRDVDHALVT